MIIGCRVGTGDGVLKISEVVEVVVVDSVDSNSVDSTFVESGDSVDSEDSISVDSVDSDSVVVLELSFSDSVDSGSSGSSDVVDSVDSMSVFISSVVSVDVVIRVSVGCGIGIGIGIGIRKLIGSLVMILTDGINVDGIRKLVVSGDWIDCVVGSDVVSSGRYSLDTIHGASELSQLSPSSTMELEQHSSAPPGRWLHPDPPHWPQVKGQHTPLETDKMPLLHSGSDGSIGVGTGTR